MTETPWHLIECPWPFRIRMLGDGCKICNPEFHEELKAQQESEDD